jgi:hypothetical protein
MPSGLCLVQRRTWFLEQDHKNTFFSFSIVLLLYYTISVSSLQWITDNLNLFSKKKNPFSKPNIRQITARGPLFVPEWNSNLIARRAAGETYFVFQCSTKTIDSTFKYNWRGCQYFDNDLMTSRTGINDSRWWRFSSYRSRSIRPNQDCVRIRRQLPAH